MRRVECKTFIIPTGNPSLRKDNLYNELVPKTFSEWSTVQHSMATTRKFLTTLKPLPLCSLESPSTEKKYLLNPYIFPIRMQLSDISRSTSACSPALESYFGCQHRSEHKAWGTLGIYPYDVTTKCEWFDSYGTPPPPEFYGPAFTEFLNKHCDLWELNDRKLQSDWSNVCRHYCIFYLSHRACGQSMKKIVQLFGNDTVLNDSKVLWFVETNFRVALKQPKRWLCPIL